MKKRISIIIIIFVNIIMIYTNTNISKATDKFLDNASISTMMTPSNGVYYIGSEHCPSCVKMKPHLIEYITYRRKHTFYFNVDNYINNDKMPIIMSKLGVEYIPTILIIKDGKVIFNEVIEDNYLNNFNSISHIATINNIDW